LSVEEGVTALDDGGEKTSQPASCKEASSLVYVEGLSLVREAEERLAR